MKITKLFDELDPEYELTNLNRNKPLDVAIDELIYAYHDGGYDGRGVAVYHDSKDQWHLDEISHCSCYGALDEGFNKIGYTKEQLLKLMRKRVKENGWLKIDYMLILAQFAPEGEVAA